MTFQAKVALITGRSSGIGLATAKALAGRGAHVWIVARGQERLFAALTQVKAACSDPSQRMDSLVALARRKIRASTALLEKKGSLP